MASAKAVVQRAQGELTAALRLYERTDARLRSVTQDETALVTFLRLEFAMLQSNAKVANIRWRGDSLVVDTVPLFASAKTRVNSRWANDDVEYDIGEFTIIISSARSHATCLNRTRRVTGLQPGMNHPHVYPDGHACLGSANETLPKLVSGFQWALAVALTIEFLESVNFPETAGRYIVEWPLSQRQRDKDLASGFTRAPGTTPAPTPQPELAEVR